MSHQPTIAIDVDGVLADYSRGWQGPGVIGEPNAGAREFLCRLKAGGWFVIIHTTRGTKATQEWMERHGLPFDAINDNPNLRGENAGKPIANVYLDDRAVCFNGDFVRALRDCETLVPWYQVRNEV